MTRRCRRFEVGVVATQDIFPRKSLRLSCGVDRIQVRPQPATASVKNIVDFSESERGNDNPSRTACDSATADRDR